MKTFVLCVLAYACLIAPSVAQNSCYRTSSLEKQLAAKYGELKFATGLARRFITELYVNPTTGSYTITRRMPGQVSCIIDAGKQFTPVAQPSSPAKPSAAS